MQKIVVTGGSRGIGLRISRRLIEAGYHVIIVARHPPTDVILPREPGSWSFIKWDLMLVGTLSDLAQRIHNENGPIYGLVNNAGVSIARVLSLASDAKIADAIHLNTLSPILLTKHLINPMIRAKEGRVVNMSSIVASTGYPGLSVYSATKAALIGFTRSLAREVGSFGITVNAVAPGFVDTEMTSDLNDNEKAKIARRSALNRMTTVDDVAYTVRFLMSAEAKNITGTVITVDAGNTA